VVLVDNAGSASYFPDDAQRIYWAYWSGFITLSVMGALSVCEDIQQWLKFAGNHLTNADVNASNIYGTDPVAVELKTKEI